MKIQYEVQHFTLCDGWINTWSVIDENGLSKPTVFNTYQEARQELNSLLQILEMEMGYTNLNDYKHQYRIALVLATDTGL